MSQQKNYNSNNLKCGGLFSKGERASEQFVPTGRDVDPEALICLECPLPECKKLVCKRYNEEMKKIKEQDND